MDEKQNIAKQLMRAFLHSRQQVSRLQARGSEKPGEIMVLHCISMNVKEDAPGLMVSEISSRLIVTSPTVTQHINSLEAQGLVERLTDPADRRVVRVRLTEEGEKYLQRIHEARIRMFVGLVDHLGEKESRLFVELMAKASDYMLKQRENHFRNYHVDGDEKE